MCNTKKTFFSLTKSTVKITVLLFGVKKPALTKIRLILKDPVASFLSQSLKMSKFKRCDVKNYDRNVSSQYIFPLSRQICVSVCLDQCYEKIYWVLFKVNFLLNIDWSNPLLFVTNNLYHWKKKFINFPQRKYFWTFLESN